MTRFIKDGEKVIANIEIRHPKDCEGAVYEVSLNGDYLGSCYRRSKNKKAVFSLEGAPIKSCS